MAEAEVLTQPASADAGEGKSDEEIIGLGQPAEDVTSPDETTKETSDEQKEGEKKTEEEKETAKPGDSKSVVAKLLKSQAISAEDKKGLQSMSDRLTAYQEVFQTVGEAAEIKSRFDSVEDADNVIADAEELQSLDSDMDSADPERYRSRLEGFAKDNPQAFKSFALSFYQNAAKIDEGIAKAIGETIVDTELRGWYQDLVGAGQAELAQAVKTLYEMRLSRRMDASQTENPEVVALRKQLEDAKKARNEGVLTVRQEAVNGAFTEARESVKVSISSTIDKLLEGTAASPSTRERIAREAFREVEEGLSGNRGYNFRLGRIPFDSANPQQYRKDIFSFVSQTAARMAPSVVKKHVDDWSVEYTSSSSQRADKLKKAAERVDVRGGTRQSVGGKTKIRVEDVKPGGKYSHLTDQEIMDL